MSRRNIIVFLLVLLLLAAIVLAVLKGGACRDPDPPEHPVPVDAPYDETSTPIAAPAAK